MKKYQSFNLKIFILLVVKFSVYLNRCVFVIGSDTPCELYLKETPIIIQPKPTDIHFSLQNA